MTYEVKQTGLGDRFVSNVKTNLELISRYPERYPKRKGNFREASVGIFPYNIVYIFYDKEGIITSPPSFIQAETRLTNTRNKLWKSKSSP